MMKTKRLWAYGLSSTAAFCLLNFSSLSVAEPADAQTKWSNWYTMHADSFGVGVDSPTEQCYDSIGLVQSLTVMHCDKLKRKIESGACKVTMVEDGERYTGMRGRVDGDPNGESKLTPNMIKKTGRFDRALRCDLGDGIVIDWYTGHWIGGEYKSCNNIGFVYHPPKPEPIPPAKPVVVPSERFMRHTGVVGSDSIQVLSPPPSNCCACSTNYGQAIIINNGGDLQSTGQSKVDW